MPEVGLELVEIYDYDLLVLDVILPGMDGLSLCQQLRDQHQHMPILLLTGQGGGEPSAGRSAECRG